MVLMFSKLKKSELEDIIQRSLLSLLTFLWKIEATMIEESNQVMTINRMDHR